MGLYYSYFKQIAIDSSSFTQGFLSVISDNRTEASTTINVLERSNLYPELLLGFIYRIMKSQDMLTQVYLRVRVRVQWMTKYTNWRTTRKSMREIFESSL
jgi:hypothetical protein